MKPALVPVSIRLIIFSVLTSSAFLYPDARAGSATWNLNPSSDDWNTAANWTPPTVPNGPTDIAIFGSSSISTISVSAPTEVGGIVFNADAGNYTINVPSDL